MRDVGRVAHASQRLVAGVLPWKPTRHRCMPTIIIIFRRMFAHVLRHIPSCSLACPNRRCAVVPAPDDVDTRVCTIGDLGRARFGLLRATLDLLDRSLEACFMWKRFSKISLKRLCRVLPTNPFHSSNRTCKRCACRQNV